MKSSDKPGETKIKSSFTVNDERRSQQFKELQNAGMINPEETIAFELNEVISLLQKLVENTGTIATELSRHQK